MKFNYVIYQVRVESDFAFMRWEWVKNHNWSFRPYRSVWNGTEEAKDDYDLLNHLFEIFNLNHPEGYRAHSMSVSDVIRINDGNEIKYYYCDSFGWKDITKEVKGEEK